MKVWVLVIQNDTGINAQVFCREDLAEEEAFKYVKEEWARKGPKNKELPTNRVEALASYFGEYTSDESCYIEQKEIITQ